MRTFPEIFFAPAVVLALSIAASPGLVNGQPTSLTSVNQDNNSNEPELKDSVKEQKAGVAQLIAAVVKVGPEQKVGKNLAPIIGLEKPMQAKYVEVLISRTDADIEQKGCLVIYEKVESKSDPVEKRPICAYISIIKRSGLDKETRFFRMDLNGKLEKVILAQGKYDESGKVIRGSGVKFDQDIESAEVKKAFEAEMKYWLKDWLKKEQLSAAKKTANAAATAPKATAR